MTEKLEELDGESEPATIKLQDRTTMEPVQIREGFSILEGQSVEEAVAHATAAAQTNNTFTAPRCITIAIVNREELQAVASDRHSIATQAKAEGMEIGQIQHAMDTLRPLPAVVYEVVEEGGDIVLAHEGHEITERELARFGLTADDLEGVK